LVTHRRNKRGSVSGRTRGRKPNKTVGKGTDENGNFCGAGNEKVGKGHGTMETKRKKKVKVERPHS